MPDKPRTPRSSEPSKPGDPRKGTANAPKAGAGEFDFLAPDDQGALGRLGSYRVLEVLGRGGMGVVFLAEDMRLHRRVALKVVRPGIARKESAKQRFLREARSTAKLEHDNIVTIYHVDEDRGVPYLAMQLLRGMSLEDWLRQGNRPALRQAVRLIRETATGLATAHAHGLIHRDIKPANLWLEKRDAATPADASVTGTGQSAVSNDALKSTSAAGARPVTRIRVKILDFGLARLTDDDTQITRQGAIVGTPAYMSPEQARGRELDARSDLFSLGCVLYRLCTGKLPFAGKDTMAVLYALANDTPEAVRKLNPEVTPSLANLIGRLLAKDPAERPASARAVADELQAIERELAGQVRPVPAPTPAAEMPASAAMPAAEERVRSGRPTPAAPEPDEWEEWDESRAPTATQTTTVERRRWLAGGLGVAGLGAVLLLSLACCLSAFLLMPGSGTVEVSAADDAARALLAKADVRVIEVRTGEALALGLGEQSFRSGRFTIDPATVPAGLRFEPSSFDLANRGTVALVAHAIAPGNPVAGPGRPAETKAPFSAVEARKYQDDWARYLHRDVDERDKLGLRLVLIPPGEFEMGSTDDAFAGHVVEIRKHGKQLVVPDLNPRRPIAEGPAHLVHITRPFLLGTCEVTVGQFRAFVDATKYVTDAEKAGAGGTGMIEERVGKGPFTLQIRKEVRQPDFAWNRAGFIPSDQQPVGNVTAGDAAAFCKWLSGQEKQTYRLPTEAEWEYACRAGTTTAWSSGDAVSLKKAPMWTQLNAKHAPHPVAQLAANPFGLFDMHGNVAELCKDYFDPGYYASNPPRDDPPGPPDQGKGNVVRGGSFLTSPTLARSAYRGGVLGPGSPSIQVGFRVVREIPAAAK